MVHLEMAPETSNRAGSGDICMTESDLMRLLQIRASAEGARLFRQNVGLAWAGNKTVFGPGTFVLGRGDVLLRKARPFRAGIKGMSDLGGWAPVTVTPGMVGAEIARVLQVEVKAGAPVTAEQQRWIEAVRAAGGLAGIARSEDDLIRILNQ